MQESNFWGSSSLELFATSPCGTAGLLWAHYQLHAEGQHYVRHRVHEHVSERHRVLICFFCVINSEPSLIIIAIAFITITNVIVIVIIIIIIIIIRGGVAEKETIKSAFFIGYVIMQVDFMFHARLTNAMQCNAMVMTMIKMLKCGFSDPVIMQFQSNRLSQCKQ